MIFLILAVSREGIDNSLDLRYELNTNLGFGAKDLVMRIHFVSDIKIVT